MQAKLVIENGEVLSDVRAYDARDIKVKLGKLAAYTAKQGMSCRIEVYHDANDPRLGDRQGILRGYYGPQLGLQDAPGLPDWYQGKVAKERGLVGRPKGEPKPPKAPAQRKHPEDCRIMNGIYLMPEHIAYARTIGNGNLSVGIRAALDYHKAAM